MEVFVDFGLFELVAALGIAAVARAVYARRGIGLAFLCVSVATPVALVVLSAGEVARWLAVGCLATSLVNGAVVLGAIQRGDVPTVTWPGRRRGGGRRGAPPQEPSP